ncbi:MAG: hypothetical protein R3C12_02140 [Planctomycetaceae bacterium]
MAVLAGEFLCPICSARLRMQQRGHSELCIDCPECHTPLRVVRNERGELDVQQVSISAEIPVLARKPALRETAIPWIVVGVLCLALGGSWWAFGSASVSEEPAPSTANTNPADTRDEAPAANVAASLPIGPQPSGATEEPAVGEANAEPAQHPFALKLQGLGTRVTAYREPRGHFPPALWEQTGSPPGRAFSWLAGLDPTLERDASLLPQWNLPWDDPLNDRFVRRKRDDLLNPEIPLQVGGDRYPASHVVGIAGVGPRAAELPLSDPRAGIFGWNRTTRMDDVKDGLSQTLLATGVTGKLTSWADGTASVRAFTQEPCINGPDGFGTGQSNGMYVLLADGSVRFLNRTTAPTIVRRMAAMADGLPWMPPSPENQEKPGRRWHRRTRCPSQPRHQRKPLLLLPGMARARPRAGDPCRTTVASLAACPKSPPIDLVARLGQTVLAYQLTTAAPLKKSWRNSRP